MNVEKILALCFETQEKKLYGVLMHMLIRWQQQNIYWEGWDEKEDGNRQNVNSMQMAKSATWLEKRTEDWIYKKGPSISKADRVSLRKNINFIMKARVLQLSKTHA